MSLIVGHTQYGWKNSTNAGTLVSIRPSCRIRGVGHGATVHMHTNSKMSASRRQHNQCKSSNELSFVILDVAVGGQAGMKDGGAIVQVGDNWGVIYSACKADPHFHSSWSLRTVHSFLYHRSQRNQRVHLRVVPVFRESQDWFCQDFIVFSMVGTHFSTPILLVSTSISVRGKVRGSQEKGVPSRVALTLEFANWLLGQVVYLY